MVKQLIILVLFLSSWLSAATLTGTIKMGGRAFNGEVWLQNTYPGTLGGILNLNQPYKFKINNGVLQAGAAVDGNDILLPAGTLYAANYIDRYGQSILQGYYYVSGSTFDLGSAVPTPFTTSNVNFLDLNGLRTLTAKNIEGIRYADQFASIQAAVSDASLLGAVIIPSTYTGTDIYTNPNNIMIWDLRHGTYANFLKFNTYGLALKSGSVLDIHGDSIALGQGTTVPASQGFAALVASSLGMTPNNTAVSGSQVQDAGQIDTIFATPVTQTSTMLWLPAFNDMRHSGVGATPLATAKHTILAGAIHASVPDAYRITGVSSGCAKTGTWNTNPGVYGNISVYSTTNGDSLLCGPVRGTTVYLIGIAAVGGGGQMSVSVDGVSYGTFNLFGFSASNLGRTYFPFVVRIPDLPNIEPGHMVQTVVTSATNIANSVNVVEVVGNGGSRDYAGPNVALGLVIHMTAAGYALAGPSFNSGSDAAVDTYNSEIIDICDQLHNDGLGVICYDTTRYNPTTQVSADNIHPGIVGAQVIADSVLSPMSGAAEPVDKAAAQLNRRSNITVYSPLPGRYGMVYSCPDATDCQIGINRIPNSGRNINPALAGFVMNFDSVGNAKFYSAAAGATSATTLQFTMFASGGISIASGAQIKNHFTATSTINFGAQAANVCVDSAGISIPGAVDGDTVVVGAPAAALVANVNFSAYVNAADTVKVRVCNVATAVSAAIPSGTYRVDVWKH